MVFQLTPHGIHPKNQIKHFYVSGQATLMTDKSLLNTIGSQSFAGVSPFT